MDLCALNCSSEVQYVGLDCCEYQNVISMDPSNKLVILCDAQSIKLIDPYLDMDLKRLCELTELVATKPKQLGESLSLMTIASWSHSFPSRTGQ